MIMSRPEIALQQKSNEYERGKKDFVYLQILINNMEYE